jgi:hypothetical protein
MNVKRKWRSDRYSFSPFEEPAYAGEFVARIPGGLAGFPVLSK